LCSGGRGAILFTSRHEDATRLGTGIKLLPLTEEEGLELLLRQSKHEKTQENITDGKKIVHMLGCLALAIDQAAAFISAQRLTLLLFPKWYQKQKKDNSRLHARALGVPENHGQCRKRDFSESLHDVGNILLAGRTHW
jgi:hypothetical protein